MPEPGEPVRLGGTRLNPGRRGVLAMAVVTVLTVLVAGGWVLASRPHPMLAAESTPTGAPATSVASPSGSASVPAGRPSPAQPAGSGLVVDVVGKVRRAGIYRLPAGARVDDAVRAAGGLLAGVDPVSVNLARRLVDGEQLVIGQAAQPNAAGPAATAPAPGSSGGAGPLDLNSATVAQLDALPGVGPVLAQHIVDWRTEHGRFDSVEQLNAVSGIGDSKFADLKALVTVA